MPDDTNVSPEAEALARVFYGPDQGDGTMDRLWVDFFEKRAQRAIDAGWTPQPTCPNCEGSGLRLCGGEHCEPCAGTGISDGASTVTSIASHLSTTWGDVDGLSWTAVAHDLLEQGAASTCGGGTDA